jgi:superfamily II DNA helicase RecQ
MFVRVITLRFDPVIESFDDAPLRDFLKDKEVLAIRDHFFIKNEAPYLVVLVTYAATSAAPPPTVAPPAQEGGWRALITAEELPLFNTLRDWRTERSRQEGVPPYVICTNRQLAAMVKARPQSLTRLADIQGFGKAKLEKYGRDMLGILAQAPVHHQPTESSHTQEEVNHAHPGA